MNNSIERTEESVRHEFEVWFCREKCYGLNPASMKAQRLGEGYDNAPTVTEAWQEWQWLELCAYAQWQESFSQDGVA